METKMNLHNVKRATHISQVHVGSHFAKTESWNVKYVVIKAEPVNIRGEYTIVAKVKILGKYVDDREFPASDVESALKLELKGVGQYFADGRYKPPGKREVLHTVTVYQMTDGRLLSSSDKVPVIAKENDNV